MTKFFQNWKRGVEAYRVPTVVREYFLEKCHVDVTSPQSLERALDLGHALAQARKRADDLQTLSYLTWRNTAPITEQFGDNTGYMSVREANILANSRPDGWR
jgi:hypothetical protein